MPGKIFAIFLSTFFSSVRKVPLSVILLPCFLLPIVISKVFLSGDIFHLIWGIKPFFLIPGYIIGQRLSGTLFEYYPTFSLREILVLVALICVGFIQYKGLDIWSGSGAFGTRSTMGFRGFGELAIVAFFIGMTRYFPILILFFLFSASKLLMLSGLMGLVAALLYAKRYAVFYFMFLFFITCILFIVFRDHLELIAKSINVALFYSVLDCDLDCSSFSNRFEAMRQQWEAVASTTYILTGSMKQSVFVVQPEVSLLYYIKLYGIIGVVPFLFILHKTNYTRWGWLFLSMLILDVYSFSMLGYFMIGVILRNAKKITKNMQTN